MDLAAAHRSRLSAALGLCGPLKGRSISVAGSVRPGRPLVRDLEEFEQLLE